MEQNLPPEVQSKATGWDAKKLWFDYIRTLHERQLQSAQRTGITNYVLLASLAGLLYKFLPSLPRFLATAGMLKSGLLILTLEMDIAFLVDLSVFYLVYYCAGYYTTRLVPETHRRVGYLRIWVKLAFFAIFAISHFVISWMVHDAGRFVRTYIVVLGGLWIVALIVALWKQISLIRKAKANKVPVPVISSYPFPPNWKSTVLSALFLILACVGIGTLIVYLHRLGNGWVAPMKGASILFIFCAALLYLADRQLWAITRGQYANLERDILLEDLVPDEIRNRFIRHMLGPDVAQWFDELLRDVSLAEQEFGAFMTSARERVKEIAQIDPRYAIERKERAKALKVEMKTALMQSKLATKQFGFQFSLLFEGYKNPVEFEILNKWMEGFNAYSANALKTLDAGEELVNELNGLLSNTD